MREKIRTHLESAIQGNLGIALIVLLLGIFIIVRTHFDTGSDVPMDLIESDGSVGVVVTEDDGDSVEKSEDRLDVEDRVAEKPTVPVVEPKKIPAKAEPVPKNNPEESKIPEEEPKETIDETGMSQTEKNSMLAVHNAARVSLGISPLVWSETLAKSATAWAGILEREGCTIRHDYDSSYGENLYWRWTTGGTPGKLVSSAYEAATGWLSEEEFYDYEENSCEPGEMCGHYTQMVWEGSLRLGCAVASCSEGGAQSDAWVCRYDPPGNYVGEKPY